MIYRKQLTETPTTGSDSACYARQDSIEKEHTPFFHIWFDKVWFWICVVAVKLCILCADVPVLNGLLRRVTLMSGSFDTNAMLCLFLRYMYTFLPEPMCFDEAERVFAGLFLEKQYFLFAWIANNVTMRLLPPLVRPLYRSYYGRAKFAAEFVERCIIERGVTQLVVLGAGFDSTAYRTAQLRRERNVRVYEVDLPRVQTRKLSIMKKKVLPEKLSTFQEGVVYVECDFGQNDLTEVLLANGYDITADTAILWEGVTYYLERAALERTLGELKRLASLHKTGSPVRLFMDYMLQKSTLEKNYTESDPIWRLNVEQAKALGTSFISGFTDIHTELIPFGISVVRHISYADIEAYYFSPSNIPRALLVFVEPNATYGHNEPHLNLAECVFNP